MYDSKKSGAITISHLRFGPKPIRAPYLVSQASFVGCHQYSFLERYDVLAYAQPGGVFLLNAPYAADEVWDELPFEVQQEIVEKQLRFFVIDAYAVAKATGMGTRINTIMQTCFFAISGVLPRDQAIDAIKHAIEKTYKKRGDAVVQRNFEAVDATLAHLHEVTVPASATASRHLPPLIPDEAPDFVKRVTAADARQPGRPAARQRVPGRRHLADRHGAVGEAERRHRDPGLGRGALHPVQQVRARLSARRDPRQGVRPGPPRRRAGDVQGACRTRGPTSPASTRCRSRRRTAPAARSA